MRRLKRLGMLAFAVLLSAGPAFAQQDAGDDPDSTATQTDQMSGIDWSVGLRGSYAANTLTGGKPSLSLTPQASLILEGESGQTIYGSGAEIIVDASKQARIADLHAGIELSYKLSTSTLLDGSINGQLTQADKDSSDLPVNPRGFRIRVRRDQFLDQAANAMIAPHIPSAEALDVSQVNMIASNETQDQRPRGPGVVIAFSQS